MGLKLKRRDVVPPGGFKYFQAETKFWITSPTYPDLISRIRKHRASNNLPVGLRFLEEIEDQICQTLPPDWIDRDDPVHRARAGFAVDFMNVLSGTGLLVEWFLTGRKKVEQTEADRRANICSSCFYNQPIQGCTSCNDGVLRDVVNKIVGGSVTQYDNHLRACKLCACSLKAKVWLPLELLVKRSSAELQEALPDWCWIKIPKEQNATTNESIREADAPSGNAA